MTADRVIYTRPGGVGWATVELMARLLATHLDAELVELDGSTRGYVVRRYLAAAPRRRGAGHCIVIAPQPVHLSSVMSARHLLRGYASVSGWVIDSFWDDRIPAIARGRDQFDQLFVTDRELVGVWEQRTGTPTSWLPFGSDVLDAPPPAPERPVDLLRVGRQPPAWDDDARTAESASARGLRFAGRTPVSLDARRNQADLSAAMRAAKLTLSFSNLVSPAEYTHPTRDYLTGRWTDALGAGCAVAGVRPRCEAAEVLLWPEATVAVDPHNLDNGLDQVTDAVRSWSPEAAARNRRSALERLDWRWRFGELAGSLGIAAPRLDDELARLCLALNGLGP